MKNEVLISWLAVMLLAAAFICSVQRASPLRQRHGGRRDRRPREQRDHHALRLQKADAVASGRSRAGLPELHAGSESAPSIKIARKTCLRDLIDQQLLIERAKDMDISVDTELIKRLDDIRKQNNLASSGGPPEGRRRVGHRLGRLQDADAQQPAYAGSDPAASRRPHGHRPR